MAEILTPRYDAFLAKVRDWANKRDPATIPDDVVKDCIRYGTDDIYRDLRVPQLELTLLITVTAEHNNKNPKFSVFDIPEDLIEFIFLAQMKDDKAIDHIYDNLPDVRTFLSPEAENYNAYRYVWNGLEFMIHPQVKVGKTIALHYYRRLPPLDALYAVAPENYSFEYANDQQPYLIYPGETTLWLVTGGTAPKAFSTEAEADQYILTNGGGKTSEDFDGREAWNWLRDANERLALYASLAHIGSYLDLAEMETRYTGRFGAIVKQLNSEEKYRKARGGNIQMNVITGGLI